jgi:uncharacterized Zn-binding protein involved in type VI secretion
MPQVSRLSDINSAGGSVDGGVANSVLCEGQPVAVVGSSLSPDSDCLPIGMPHCSPVIVQGSSTVFAEGIPVAFVGSANDCGHSMATGASTVFVAE